MSFAPKQFIRSVDFLSTENAINTSTGCVNIYGGMSVSKDSYLTHMIVVGTSTVANLTVTGTLTTSSGNLLAGTQWSNNDTNIYFGTSASTFVGIGTSTPTFNLDISGGSRITGGLTVGNLNVNTGASITNILNTTICTGTIIVTAGSINANFNSHTLGNIITTGGNVGIGIALPSKTLHISSSSDLPIRVDSTSTANNSGIAIGSNSSIGYGGSTHSNQLVRNRQFLYSANDIVFISSNSTSAAMFIQTSGNVGIGTSSPGSRLEVNGTIKSGDITVGNINFTGSLYQNGSAYLGSQWTTTSGNTLTYTSGSISINSGFSSSFNSNTLGNIFTTGGNIGIGTTSPSRKLHVVGDAIVTDAPLASQALVEFYADGSRKGAWYRPSGLTDIRFFSDITGSDIMVFGSTGNVGLGTTAPSFKIDATGTSRFTSISSTNQTISNLNVSISETVGSLVVRTTASLLGTSNTIGSIFTTGGNVGVGTTAPAFTLDVTGTIDASTYVTSGALYSTNQTTTNIVGTNISTSTLLSSNITSYNSTIYLRGDTNHGLRWAGSGNSWGNYTPDGPVLFGYAAGALGTTVTNGLGKIILTWFDNGNVGIGTTSPGNTLDVSGTARFTTSVTTGALYSTNQTTTNIVGTNLSSNNLVSTTSTFGSNTATGIQYLLNATTIQATTNNYSLTSGALNVTGDIVLSGSELMFTTTNVGAPTLNGRGWGSKIVLYPETGTTRGDYSIGVESAYTWFQAPSLSTHGFKFYQGTTASVIINPGGHVSILNTANISTISAGSLFLSGNLSVAGTLTTVNITATNLVNTNVSAGVVVASTLLSATGNSNTIGNVIYTTGGNVGIGTSAPTGLLNLSSTAQTQPRLILSGQEFYAAGNTSTSGVALLAGVNRSTNRQLWIADSALLAQNTTNPVIRLIPNGPSINAIATDGTTPLPLSLGSGAGYNLTIATNGNIGIGTTSPSRMLSLNGPTTNITAGPHLWINTSDQTNPVFQMLNWSGDNVSLNFDMYYDGAFRNSGSSTAWQIYKSNSQIRFMYQNGTAGTSNGQSNALILGSTGNIGIMIGNGINFNTGSSINNGAYSLHTVNSSPFPVRLSMSSDGAVQRPFDIGYYTGDVTSGAWNSRFYVNGYSGSVGLGTQSPRSNLEVTGTTSTSGMMLYAGNDTGVNSIFFNHSNTTSQYQKVAIQTQALGTNQYGRSHFGILVNTAGDATNVSWSDAKFFIHGSSGNIGIGTAAPSTKLHIEDGSVFIGDVSAGFSTSVPSSNTGVGTANGYRLFFDNSFNSTAGTGVAANKIVLHNNNFTCGFGLENLAVTYHSGQLHRFYCDATTGYGSLALSVGSSQTIAYTNTNGEGLLKIGNSNAGSSAYSVLRIGNNVGDAVMFLNSSTRTADGGTNTFNIRNDVGAMRLQGLGGNNTLWLSTGANIGIGTTSPSYPLHVSGDIYATGDVISFSDARLKTDVVTIENALEKVSGLRGVYYTNSNTQQRETGVIAQEIAEILPEVVADKGEYLGVAYGNIVGILIEAIKELKEKVNVLESQLNS